MHIDRIIRLFFSSLVFVLTVGGHVPAAHTQPSRFTTGAENEYHPRWSPDGTRIAFTRRTDTSVGVWLKSAGGGDAEQLDLGKTGDLAFSWSPDGAKIVFDAYTGSTPPSDLYVVEISTGNVQHLTDYSGSENHPDWSPDGTHIAFTWKGEIWIVPVAGGSPTRLTSGHNDWHPCWSPDGGSIAFSSDRSGNTDIWTVPAAGGIPTQITSDAADDDRASWSPDGTRIAFGSNRDGNVDIWTITLADGALEQITTDAAFDSHANWSPDGTKLAFASQRSGSFDVWIVDSGLVPVKKHSWGSIKHNCR